MNSSLQCLMHSKNLIKNLESLQNKNSTKMRLVNEILKLLETLKNFKEGEKKIVDPSKIKEILSEVEEKYKYNQQNDANEFITIFLNQLLIELKGLGNYHTGKKPTKQFEMKAFDKLEDRFFDKNKSFLLNLFYGRLKREYFCEKSHIYIYG